MDLRLNLKLNAEELAEEMTQLDHAEFIEFVMNSLDAFACAEVDEELLARIWRGLQDCYDPGERPPSLADLLEQYPPHTGAEPGR